jgi:hypothetical protein
MTAYSNKMAKLNAIADAVNAPCRWPSCPCYAKRRDLTAAALELADPAMPIPTLAEIDAVTVSYYTMLACMAHRCRDLHERGIAKEAMLHPMWEDFNPALTRLNTDDYSDETVANVVSMWGRQKQ